MRVHPDIYGHRYPVWSLNADANDSITVIMANRLTINLREVAAKTHSIATVSSFHAGSGPHHEHTGSFGVLTGNPELPIEDSETRNRVRLAINRRASSNQTAQLEQRPGMNSSGVSSYHVKDGSRQAKSAGSNEISSIPMHIIS